MMRVRWHLLKTSLFCNLAVFAVLALTIFVVFDIARHDPDFVLAALTSLQPIASFVLAQAGELGAFASVLADSHPARLEPRYADLGPYLYRTTIVLGILFGVFYDLLLPRALALTVKLLRTDQRTSAKIERDSREYRNRTVNILFRILFPLYFIYVSDIGSRFEATETTETLHHEVSSQLLFFCLMTYLISAIFFSGLFGFVRRAKQQVVDGRPATRHP